MKFGLISAVGAGLALLCGQAHASPTLFGKAPEILALCLEIVSDENACVELPVFRASREKMDKLYPGHTQGGSNIRVLTNEASGLRAVTGTILVREDLIGTKAELIALAHEYGHYLFQVQVEQSKQGRKFLMQGLLPKSEPLFSDAEARRVAEEELIHNPRVTRPSDFLDDYLRHPPVARTISRLQDPSEEFAKSFALRVYKRRNPADSFEVYLCNVAEPFSVDALCASRMARFEVSLQEMLWAQTSSDIAKQ